MPLESGSYVDDLVITSPTSTENKSQGDDHLRLIKGVLRGTFPRAAKPFPFFAHSAKTASYGVLSTDEHKFFTGNGAGAVVDFALPILASTLDGWFVVIRASDITNAVTITPASGTINGAASVTFDYAGQTALVWFDGTNFFAMFNQKLDFIQLPTLTTPAMTDAMLVYDTSASRNKVMALSYLYDMIALLTAETSPAADDLLPFYDTSETAANSITLANLFKVINALTEDTDPDPTNDFLVTYDASGTAAKKVALHRASALASRMFHIRDQKATNTAPGSFAAGAWRTRDLTTVMTNQITGASLTANQFVLPAGTYVIDADCPALAVNNHQARLRNITAGSTTLVGGSTYSSNSTSYVTVSRIYGEFTIVVPTTFEIQHQGQASGTFGKEANVGEVEVYSDVRIVKLK